MATQTAGSSTDFIKNLGRMYGTYTGAFLAFIVLLAILEQVGVPNKILGYLFVGFTIAVYAIIGVMTRTAQISEYYVAGRRVPAFYNGMATGADWMSAGSFVGMGGSLFLQGYDGIAWVLGWTGGFVLVSILVGPYLRKFGAYTVPDFMAFRFGGNFARFLAVIVLVCCSFTYVTAQIYGTGLIASRFLGMPFEIAVFAGLVGILLCAMLGGMRAVTWSLLFIFLLYFSAPAYAAFSKLEVYTNILGSSVGSLKPWLFTWGELGLIQICGKNAASLDAAVAACKAIAGHPGVVRFQDFVINTDVIVLSTPEIAGLPYVISGLVAAGGLAAALSTADGLLLAIANALSHD